MFNTAYRFFAVALVVLAAGATKAKADAAEATVAGLKFSLELPCNAQRQSKDVPGGSKATMFVCADKQEIYSVVITEYPAAVKELGSEALLEQYVTAFTAQQPTTKTKSTPTRFLTYPASNTLAELKTQPPMQLKSFHVAADGVTISVMALTSPEAANSAKMESYFTSLKIEAAR